MNRRVRATLVWVFFALMFVYAGANLHQTVSLLQSYRGWYVFPRGSEIVIDEVRYESPAAQYLERGDVVVELNGKKLENIREFLLGFRTLKSGTQYTIGIKRGGEVKQFVLTKDSVPWDVFLLRLMERVVVPYIFLLTGFTVFLLKPYDKLSTLLALSLGMCLNAVYNEIFAALPLWILGFVVVANTVRVLFFPVFLNFLLLFPEPKGLSLSILSRYPNIKYVIYLPYILLFVPTIGYLNFLKAFAPDRAYVMIDSFESYFRIIPIINILYVIGATFFLIENYRKAGELSQRKTRVVVAGSTVAIAAWLVFNVLALASGMIQPNVPKLLEGVTRLLYVLTVVSLPIVPLSFAYAVVRHQVIPVSLIIKRGARYLFVSRGFIFIEAAVLVGVVFFMLSGDRIRLTEVIGVRSYILLVLVVTALVFICLRLLNMRVMPMIDRYFFRDSYDAQRILSELSQAVREFAQIDQILEFAARKIQDAFHLQNVTVFLLDDLTGEYRSQIILSLKRDGRPDDLLQPVDQRMTLSSNAFVVKRMKDFSMPLSVDFEDFAARDRALSTEEQKHPEIDVLRALQSELLLPLVTKKEELLGIISLGPRLSDLPFSKEDKQLLMAVAWQIALAIENSKLFYRMAEEERLRQELEMATDVQRRLFPQSLPVIDGVQLAGICLPARGVGGDYYDFLTLGTERVGIAVADVAGKGISAALLMSIVQASLRSQAPAVDNRLTDLVSSMNRLLHRSTGPSSYATFFYAQFDRASMTLTYVNAGHNPPLLVRRSPGGGYELALARRVESDGIVLLEEQIAECEVQLLNSGGVAIGLFDRCIYTQETISLEPGDILVAYTDGVTEALCPEGEEFGEDRLRELILDSYHLSAEELKDKIVQCVKDWCRNRPQEDDLTLAILKVV